MNRINWTVAYPSFKWNESDPDPTPALEEGAVISLITPAELATLQPGTELFTIFGDRAVVGTDRIDEDTRGGFLAYGFKL